ncbi:MAG: zinc-dependent alcohol dehydrogenase family protein [Chitinophagales bacterium]
MNLPETMQAMLLESAGSPLVNRTLPLPRPSSQQVLVKVIACGVCRTDLHILDGELTNPKLPLIIGHEIIGMVVSLGPGVDKLEIGDMVGIPWMAYTCGTCKYCLSHHENLCNNALFTGYTIDGGFAEYTVAFQDFCFPIPDNHANPSAAPLLCAGMIGYRSYGMINREARDIGIYGFGAAAHILIQIALFQRKRIYAFTRDGDMEAQAFARKLGAIWAGDSSSPAPKKLDAAIIFAPVGDLIPKALQSLDKGGTVICGGIHMSDIPAFPYKILWEERMIRSVANLTRKDGVELLNLATQIPVKTEIQLFSLQEANQALGQLRNGRLMGAAVLAIG